MVKKKQNLNPKGRAAKSVLRLTDLEVAKSAVLNSLSCPDALRGYRHAIDEFVDWYCSEPRLSFSKTVGAVPNASGVATSGAWNDQSPAWGSSPSGARPQTAAFSAPTWRPESDA